MLVGRGDGVRVGDVSSVVGVGVVFGHETTEDEI